MSIHTQSAISCIYILAVNYVFFLFFFSFSLFKYKDYSMFGVES